jgi:hypothetical protein
MKCPHCKHESAAGVLVKCTDCGQYYDRSLLEEFEHLEYLLKWIELNTHQLGPHAQELQDQLATQISGLRNRMHLPEEAAPIPSPAPVVVTASQALSSIAAPSQALAPAAPEVASPPPPPPAPDPLPAPQPAPIPQPPSPARPASPPIDWSKVWDKAVNFITSGLLLRSLLYLGAFMTVVSATVLVVRFWDIFPPVLQIVFIFLVPTLFYLAGWLTRTRLKLEQAGMVITGVGSVLLAVDFGALYQLSNLSIGPNQYWLISSALCTGVYIFTLLRIRQEFFSYLTLLAGGSTVLALTRSLQLPLEWSATALPFYGLGLTGLALALNQRSGWQETVRAARILPQLFTPLSLLALLFASGPNSRGAQMTAALLAAGMYGLQAWQFPGTWLIHPALICLALGLGLGNFLSPSQDPRWLPLTLAALTNLYLLGSRLFTSSKLSGFALQKQYRLALHLYAGLLGLLTIWLAGTDLLHADYNLPACLALAVLALGLCVWNYLLENYLLGLAGATLLLAPVYGLLQLLHLPQDYFPPIFALLASLGYIPTALLIRPQHKKLAIPFYLVGYAVSAGLLAISVGWSAPRYPWAPVVLLATLLGLYIFSIWRFKNPAPLWGAMLALPLLAWRKYTALELDSDFFFIVLIPIGLLYLLVDRWLASLPNPAFQRQSMRVPLVLGQICLVVAGPFFAVFLGVTYYSGNTNADLITFGLLIIYLALAARLYRKPFVLLFMPLASGILMITLMDKFGYKLLWHEFKSVDYLHAWAVLAWLHFLAAALLDRTKTRYSHSLYLDAYFLITVQVLLSINEPNLAWSVGALLLMMATSQALLILKRYQTWQELCVRLGQPEGFIPRLARGAFVWVLAWLLPVWFTLLLPQLNIPEAYLWLAISLPLPLYLLLAARLSARGDSANAWPLLAAAHVGMLAALLNSSTVVIAGILRLINNLPLLPALSSDWHAHLAQALVQIVAVLFYTGWAVQRRARVFAHLAAWLSFLPFNALLFMFSSLHPLDYPLAWMGWAMLLMLTGFILDQFASIQVRYAQGPALAGILLAFIALGFSLVDRQTSLGVLGLCILSALLSFAAIHYKKHRSYLDFSGYLFSGSSLLTRLANLAPLFFGAYALPLWVVDWMGCRGWGLNPQGLVLTLMAPLAIGLGLWLRSSNRDYTWPLYSAGYALTVLGPLTVLGGAGPVLPTLISVLLIDTAVYAASALVFRRAFWLHLATFLLPLPLLMTLAYNHLLDQVNASWLLIGLAYAYFAAGQLLDRQVIRGAPSTLYAPAFYAPAFLLLPLALVTTSQQTSLEIGIFTAAVLAYAFSAWRFKQPLLLYPAAWLATVPYHLLITTSIIVPSRWLGLTWLPFILLYIALGRWVFGRDALHLRSPGPVLGSLKIQQAPFYLMAYALSVVMVMQSRSDPLAMTLACAAASLLYLGSALLFRHPAWLYPALLMAHLTILSYFGIHPSGAPVRMLSLPFMLLTALELLAGALVSRRYPVSVEKPGGGLVFKLFGQQLDFGSLPSLGHLSVPSWSQPIFIVALLDTLLWESLALSGLDTGLWVSLGFILVYATLASLWADRLLAFATQIFAALALACQLRTLGFSPAQTFAGLAGLGFGLYLLSLPLGHLFKQGRAAIWTPALQQGALALTSICCLATLPSLGADAIPCALALAFTGSTLLSLALQKHSLLQGYLGMGLLLAGWSLFLFVRDVPQPQYYALPAGLYFSAIGFLERRRHPGRFALLTESFGLLVMLTTSFLQSFSLQNGFIYFLLLLVEALLVSWWGAARRLRVPFLIGLLYSVLNILAQLVVLVRVYEVSRWLIIFGVGALLMGVGLLVERRREKLLAQAREFRDMLEKWD